MFFTMKRDWARAQVIDSGPPHIEGGPASITRCNPQSTAHGQKTSHPCTRWRCAPVPPAPGWQNQPAYEIAFGSTWRIVGASLCAFFCGEFVNSFVLARMKVKSNGRHLWQRTIGSTIVGEGVDSALFYPIAFWNSGLIPNELLPGIMLTQFVSKVAVEVMFTPLTYRIVAFLKRAENEDHYDVATDFTPFSMRL